MKKIGTIKKKTGRFLKKKWGRSPIRVWHTMLGLIFVAYLLSLPKPLFKDPTSTVILDREGKLLGARIAKDGQWRFPPMDSVPNKFKSAICTFEDKRFDYHPGVDPMAIFRAIWLNLSSGEIKSGGSTLSMQVIRLSRKGKRRTLWEKLKEIILATRLELRHSKEEILNMYATYAPFGGNVVGLETAAWKYYGRKAEDLSWSETCTLAVLPNAPGLIHPGRNRDNLLKKRNFLLGQLLEDGLIDSLDWELALLEELPEKPLPLPRYSPHLLERIHQDRLRTEEIHSIKKTTIDRQIQLRTNEIVRRHHNHLSQSGIHNLAVLVLEVESGDILSYIGNAPCKNDRNGCAVDIVSSARSTGSILKPFLYAEMLDEGELLPGTLVPDVPSFFGGFTPNNFNRSYEGAIPAKKALARSLNVPIVHMLKEHGVDRFQSELKSMGMRTLHRPADDYGLTLVLGGAEANLWDLAGIYASMARSLKTHTYYGGKYNPSDFHPPNFLLENTRTRLAQEDFDQLEEGSLLTASSIYQTFEALIEVSRPNVDNFWQQFSSSQKIAWKTGTSYGFRDAWAIGVRPEYVVAVWVGNADGEGKQGIVGAVSAAPIMLDIFDALPASEPWFEPPYQEMSYVPLCKQSGQRLGLYCTDADSTWITSAGLSSDACAYHQMVNLDPTGNYRVLSACEKPLNMVQKSYFVLPPVQERYYRRNDPSYEVLPAYRSDCEASIAENTSSNPMQIIYPSRRASLLIPVDLDGKLSSTVFEAVHSDPKAIVYWHLDDKYMGKSVENHELSLRPVPGKHRLTLVDDKGFTLSRSFEIIEEES
ncbi:MAG: penicillin-binding protein 1C [Bacteroidia bacterium]|nr:penicillin-binding protein 1C [Bacteroidia bacterium]